MAATLPGESWWRDDVAATLPAVPNDDRTIGLTFELFDGSTPMAEALEGLARAAGRA